jgi:hypothetical protein
LKESGTLGHEVSAIFREVLVRRTDDLDRGYQPSMPLGVIDSRLILVLHPGQTDSRDSIRNRKFPVVDFLK